MSEGNLSITYRQIPSVSFSEANSMMKYLASEKVKWKELLESVRRNGQLSTIPTQYGSLNVEALAGGFDTLLSRINDTHTFNQSTLGYRNEVALPPPSASLEGQLILGLMSIGRNEDATCAYLSFALDNLNLNIDSHRNLKSLAQKGSSLLLAGYASAAVPFGRVSGQKLAAVQRTSDETVEVLKREINKARKINADHERELEGLRKSLVDRSKRIEAVVLRRESHRRTWFSAWKAVLAKQTSEKFTEGDRKLRAVEVFNHRIQKTRDSEYQRLVDLFHIQLRLKAPVALWEGRASEHNKKARSAIRGFFALGLLAVLMGALIPFIFGDYIAASFVTEVCSVAEPPVCARELSAKGPLSAAGILLIMSLMLWGVRLQYRVFLSERHLSLDASEKKAFAETYLAIKEGANVNSSSEAIVLASLFRPTQDGIIRDDESGFDLSAAAVFAKQLGRPGP